MRKKTGWNKKMETNECVLWREIEEVGCELVIADRVPMHLSESERNALRNSIRESKDRYRIGREGLTKESGRSMEKERQCHKSGKCTS